MLLNDLYMEFLAFCNQKIILSMIYYTI